MQGLLGLLRGEVGILESVVLNLLLLGFDLGKMLHVLLKLLFLCLLFHLGNNIRSFLRQSPNEIVVTCEIETEIELQVLY